MARSWWSGLPRAKFTLGPPRGGGSDQGPGIADLAAILEGRYRSATGLGIGITGTLRLMDRFDGLTNSGAGTTVTLGQVIPAGHPPLTGPAVAALAEAMRGWSEGPQAAMREQ